MVFNDDCNGRALPQSSNNDDNAFTTTPKSKLLNLPAEIRLLIYSYALRERNSWDIRHKETCYGRDRSGLSESVPFVSTVDWCSCHKSHRQALRLLLTCRQIHHEATPVWYQNNTMCFYLATEQGDNVRELYYMRPLIVTNIRHISIRGRRTRRQWDQRFRKNCWDSIMGCSNLETLEIPPKNLDDLPPERLNQLLNLPHFRSLRVVSMIDVSLDVGTFFMRLNRTVPLPFADEESVEAFLEDFSRHEAEVEELAPPQIYDHWEKCSTNEVDEEPETRVCLALGKDVTQWVRVYCLPNTSRVRTRLEQAEQAEG